MQLKKLSADDKEIIKELFLSVFSNEPWNDDWSDKKQLDCYITDLTGNRNSLVLGFFDGENLTAVSMGSVKHWYTGTEYCIDEFCVSPDLQRKGIGTEFMNSIRKHLAENGITQIFLLTNRNVPAFGFYLKNGFTENPGLVSMYGTAE